jgi:hypothetical protein
MEGITTTQRTRRRKHNLLADKSKPFQSERALVCRRQPAQWAFGSKPAAAAFSFYIDIGFHFALTQCRHFNETLKNIALVEPPSGDVALCVLGFRPSGTAIIRTPLPR